MFETLRRLLLTGGQIILNPGTPSQIVLNLIICIFSMKIYAKYHPFVNAKADKLAEIAQYQLFFTMLAALCIKVDISEEDNYNKRVFDLCLSGLQLTGPVLLVYQGFVQGGAKGAVLNTEVGGAMDDVRAVARSYSDAKEAAKELEILRALGGHAPAFDEGGDNAGGRAAATTEGHPNVVSMLDAFVHRGGNQSQSQSQSQSQNHAAPSLDGGFRCLVFELLSHSLYDVLRSTSFKGVSLGLVRKFARQIFSALSFLRSIGVVHCDVKPENVLLVSADRSAVKLIDFGSSCFVGDTPDFTYVQSRFYRAAEVILGLPYGVEIDTWSLGCVLVEMHAGTPLFPGRDERDQLGKIAEALGPVPAWMRERCPPEKRSVHYPHLVGAGQPGGGVDQHQNQNQVLTRSRSKSTGSAEGASFGHDGPHDGSTGPIPGSRPLRGVIAAAARKFELSRPGGGGGATGMDVDPTAALSFHTLGIDDGRREGDSLTGLSSSQTDVVLFCDLVERIVTWNPESRLSPDDALSHQFFGNEPAGMGGGSQPSSGGSGRRVSDAGFEMDFEMDLDDEAVARLGEFPAR